MLEELKQTTHSSDQNQQIYPQEKTVEKCLIKSDVRCDSSNQDSEENFDLDFHLTSSNFAINRQNSAGFEKTGNLIKKMKRELSIQTLSKKAVNSNKKLNDRLSAQSTYPDLDFTESSLAIWQKIQKDEMAQAIVCEYERQILRLKTELEDIKQQKKEIKQLLQNQRINYMSEMYQKQLILEENQLQIQNFKQQIDKHLHLEYQFQEKIRLLELENQQYKYQIYARYSLQNDNSQQIQVIKEEYDESCSNSIGFNCTNNKNEKYLFDYESFYGIQGINEDPQKKARSFQQKQVQSYEQQIFCLKEFYENKSKLLEKFISPKLEKSKVSIKALDEYKFPDNISCQSLVSGKRPNNLRHQLKDQQNQGKKTFKTDDTTSFKTTNFFSYPQISKNFFFSEDQNVLESELEESNEKILHPAISKQKIKNKLHQNTQKVNQKYFSRMKHSKQFIKGFFAGALTASIAALSICKYISKF